jgi:hypothetical protein
VAHPDNSKAEPTEQSARRYLAPAPHSRRGQTT